MEKVGALISRLQEQYRQQADETSLLNTALLLVNELQNKENNQVVSGTVSIIMPYKPVEIHITESTNGKEEEAPATEEASPSIESSAPEAEEEVAPGITAEEPQAEEEPVPSTINTIAEEHYSEVFTEVPTLAQQQPKVTFELNEAAQSDELSVNDKLKKGAPETSDKLQAEPIKDLRKAIGINDKYLFMRELFRNDEPAYERSLKTINSFNILQEAEYWIQREMKYKLGWDDNDPTVKAFYQLVKRRFS